MKINFNNLYFIFTKELNHVFYPLNINNIIIYNTKMINFD